MTDLMPGFTAQVADAVQAALSAARARGAYAIARGQARHDASVLVINGRTEHLGVSRGRGVGVQAFTASGHGGFAASDDPATGAEVAQRAVDLAHEAGARDLETNLEIFQVPPLVAHDPAEPWAPPDLPAVEAALTALNEAVRKRDARLSVRSSFSVTHDAWQVGRTDGTDVRYTLRRARLGHEITARGEHGAATTSAGVVGVDVALLGDAEALARLAQRARRAADLAIALLDAPRLASGSYKLVIDHALAKGLAHEAFGHAAETDSMQASILGEEGRFRRGERVAPSYVSILDGPLPADYAYQPYSSNGERRQTVTIVRAGVLDEALADTFSARRAGVPPTGAARVEHFAALPMPRMTNTRILVDDPISLPHDPDEVTPEQMRALLLAHGLMQQDERVLFLTGYRGGQVNTSLGDFVFQCTAIHDLSDLTLYQPAIFSGKVLSVLSAIRAGIGDPRLDAPGMCGKRGQSVPSSGGSHAFLLVDAHPEVRVGGAAA
ncbi:MAG: TldD/PmbA family protein [Candidatus Sericytochromatia bacterium]|nr:TldD/PmbA family protein [Candidatus Sericytochromatia bacterium]